MQHKPGRRKPTNVSINSELLEQAREYGINLSRAAEIGIAEATARAKAEHWREENEQAIQSSNTFVEKHGLPLEKYRQF